MAQDLQPFKPKSFEEIIYVVETTQVNNHDEENDPKVKKVDGVIKYYDNATISPEIASWMGAPPTTTYKYFMDNIRKANLAEIQSLWKDDYLGLLNTYRSKNGGGSATGVAVNTVNTGMQISNEFDEENMKMIGGNFDKVNMAHNTNNCDSLVLSRTGDFYRQCLRPRTKREDTLQVYCHIHYECLKRPGFNMEFVNRNKSKYPGGNGSESNEVAKVPVNNELPEDIICRIVTDMSRTTLADILRQQNLDIDNAAKFIKNNPVVLPPLAGNDNPKHDDAIYDLIQVGVSDLLLNFRIQSEASSKKLNEAMLR
jgi:hypothetical protein